MPETLCADLVGSQFLIISENVPPFIYYSHVPPMLIGLLLGLFVFFKNPRGRQNQALIFTVGMFFIWVFLDIIFWATNRADEIMFAWATIILIELLTFAGAAYLSYLFLRKKDMPFKGKALLALGLFPTILFLPTKYNLSGFDLASCLSIEGPIALYYSYIFEILVSLWILFFGLKVIREKTKRERKEASLFLTGILLFLLTFSFGNIVGSITTDWELAQYGLFGMPILIGFLAYLIVEFKIFNAKLISAQALATALWIIVASMLFVTSIEDIRTITFITLILVFLVGLALSRSVKKEVEQRERLEEVTKALGQANAQLKEDDKLKSEFLSFASHDLKSPVSKMKQWASLLADKTIKEPKEVDDTLFKIKNTGDRALRLVDEFLSVRKIEEGKLEYNFEERNFVEFTKEIVQDFKPVATREGLEINFESSADEIKLRVDTIKMRQVVENLVDNAIKYTEEGTIEVELKDEQKSVLLSVKDSGLGIKKEIIPSLFEQFHRASGKAKTIKGSGLGLYIAKQIVDAHHGEIWVESEGEGQGATFFVRLPKN